MDVSNHLLSGSLGIWHYGHQVFQILLLWPATNPSSYCTGLPSPLLRAVSQLLTPAAHLCPRTAVISSSSTDSLGLHLFCSCQCQISLHKYTQWPCQTLSPPPLLGQMSSLVFQCCLIENHMMSKGLTRSSLNHSLSNDSYFKSLLRRISFKTLYLSNETCACTGCSPVIFPAPHCHLILQCQSGGAVWKPELYNLYALYAHAWRDYDL